MENNIISDGIWVGIEEYNLLIQSEERMRLLQKAFNEMEGYDFDKVVKLILTADESPRG